MSVSLSLSLSRHGFGCGSGRRPKDWLFSASVVDDGGIDEVRQLLLFSSSRFAVHGQAQELLCRPQR